jgi:hypothetical protein
VLLPSIALTINFVTTSHFDDVTGLKVRTQIANEEEEDAGGDDDDDAGKGALHNGAGGRSVDGSGETGGEVKADGQNIEDNTLQAKGDTAVLAEGRDHDHTLAEGNVVHREDRTLTADQALAGDCMLAQAQAQAQAQALAQAKVLAEDHATLTQYWCTIRAGRAKLVRRWNTVAAGHLHDASEA